MSERKIGKVISVNSFRIVVQLDDDLKSMYKSGFNDIYEIARINSYLIIPIGADRIVAIITQVRIQDETEIEKNSGYITLPKAQRYLVATMIGTIENESNYIQGVYNYPILDNPVWYVVKEDLDKIFDTALGTVLDFTKDYYLPIGTSPAFSDYKIKINPDKFFGKHAAILGNTGSGKSCSMAAILQSLFAFEYNNQKLQSSHFIIFDTNGEYKRAFIGDDQHHKYVDRSLVNTFYVDKHGLQVPFWFMNFDDFDFLFEPSANTQAPILKRAIGLAKNKNQVAASNVLSKFLEKGIIDLVDLSPDELKKKKCTSHFGNWNYNPNNEVLDLANAITPNDHQILVDLKGIVTRLGGNLNRASEDLALTDLSSKVGEYLSQKNSTKVALEKNIDLPIQFDFEKLIIDHFDEAINEQEGSSNRIREFVSTLRLRLQAYLGDERIASPLLLNNAEVIGDGLAKFLSFILGDFFKIFKADQTDPFTNYFKEQIGNDGVDKLDSTKASQITIIDMSLLPFEVLETITGLIGRLILEFQSRFIQHDRGKMPVVVVLEEAHNYIPEHDRKDKISISKRVFERIAREGRKYGISLLVSSQRPSELSKTVLSQCNSFVVHRLQNPEDQRYVRQLVSAANEDILQQLPILPQQNAIIMGDCVRTPVQVRINKAFPTPNSNNPKFIENWILPLDASFPNYREIANAWEQGITTEYYLAKKEEKQD
jgi:uncharacterized protein